MTKALAIIITLLLSTVSSCMGMSMPMASTEQTAPGLSMPQTAQPEPAAPIAMPASVPTAAPALAAPTAMPTAAPAQVLPAPVTTTVPTALPAAQAPQAYDKEINQIETSVQKINTTKQATKQILNDLDSQINNAQQQIAQAKKLSFDILRSGSEQEAQEQFTKIQKLLTEMQAVQNSAQTDVSKKFNDNIADIKVQIALIENLLNTLQAQGAFTQAVPAQMPVPAQKAIEPEKPLATKIADLFANSFAYCIYGIKKAVNWIMEPPVNDKKKSPDAEKTTPEVAPAAQNIPGATAKSMLSTQISLLTKTSEVLDQVKLDLELKFQNIDQTINALFARLQTFAPIKERLQNVEKKASIAQDMSGKEIILHLVSKTLDLIIISVTAIKDLIVKTYRYFFAPAVQQFSQDVSKKLETIDKETDKNAVTKEQK